MGADTALQAFVRLQRRLRPELLELYSTGHLLFLEFQRGSGGAGVRLSRRGSRKGRVYACVRPGRVQVYTPAHMCTDIGAYGFVGTCQILAEMTDTSSH